MSFFAQLRLIRRQAPERQRRNIAVPSADGVDQQRAPASGRAETELREEVYPSLAGREGQHVRERDEAEPRESSTISAGTRTSPARAGRSPRRG